jgi:hypothetical protein
MNLEQILKDNNISYYQIAQMLGKNPIQCTGIIKAKIIGKKPMKYAMLVEICQIINKLSGKSIEPSSLAMESVSVMMK